MEPGTLPAADQLWAQAVAAAVQPTPQEHVWEDIPWRTDLWSARREALSAHRPLLLWVGQGHPLGMTAGDCLVDRATAWADPALGRILSERFIPVALDGWFLSRRTDAVGRFFAAIIAQAQATRPNVITQGIYCVTSDGALLAQCSCGSASDRVQGILDDALHAFASAVPPSPIPDAGPLDALHDPKLPPTGVVLIAHARHLIANGGAYRPVAETGGPASSGPGREYVWLSAVEWQALAAAARQADGSRPCPEAISRKLARFALLDTTHGEAMPWENGDIDSLSLSLCPDLDASGRGRLRLAGQVRLATSSRSYEAQLARASRL